MKIRKNLNTQEKGAGYFPNTLEKVHPNSGITYSHSNVHVDLDLLTWKDGRHILGERIHLRNSTNQFFEKYIFTCTDALSKRVYDV